MPRVILIAREFDMPPIGAVGTVVGEFEGDLEVEFDGYPCEAGPGTDWLCDPRWVVYLQEPDALPPVELTEYGVVS